LRNRRIELRRHGLSPWRHFFRAGAIFACQISAIGGAAIGCRNLKILGHLYLRYRQAAPLAGMEQNIRMWAHDFIIFTPLISKSPGISAVI
jgi:hypothetical protein